MDKEFAVTSETDSRGFAVRDRRTKNRYFIDNAIIRDYGKILGPYGLAVYMALCLHADSYTQDCFPSHKYIADEIGCGARKVREMVHALEDLGLIKVEARFDSETHKQTSNLYFLLPVPPLASPATPPGTTDTRPGYPTCRRTIPNEQSPMNNPQSPPSAVEWSASPTLEDVEEPERERVHPLSEQESPLEYFERGGHVIPERGYEFREVEIPLPSPDPIEITITPAARGEFTCPNCEVQSNVDEVDRKASTCPECGSQLCIILEGDHSDKILRKPKKVATKAAYSIVDPPHVWACTSRRQMRDLKRRLEKDRTLMRRKLLYFKRLWGQGKCRTEDIVQKAIRAFDTERRKLPLVEDPNEHTLPIVDY